MRNYFSLQRYQIKFIINFTEFTSQSVLFMGQNFWMCNFYAAQAQETLGSTIKMEHDIYMDMYLFIF